MQKAQTLWGPVSADKLNLCRSYSEKKKPTLSVKMSVFSLHSLQLYCVLEPTNNRRKKKASELKISWFFLSFLGWKTVELQRVKRKEANLTFNKRLWPTCLFYSSSRCMILKTTGRDQMSSAAAFFPGTHEICVYYHVISSAGGNYTGSASLWWRGPR